MSLLSPQMIAAQETMRARGRGPQPAALDASRRFGGVSGGAQGMTVLMVVPEVAGR